MASAGWTLTLEKTSGFGSRDVQENLCVLLLILPSAIRETKEQLRMFRDSGGIDRFFPADDYAAAHRKLLNDIPNLDTFEPAGGFWGRHAKTSLGTIPSVCCGRCSSSMKDTRPTAGTPGRRWKDSIPA